MSSDPISSDDLQLIQDWIDQHPLPESDQLLSHDDTFDFDQFCDTQSLHQLQQISDCTQIWEDDAFQADLYYQPFTSNGACDTLETSYAAGTTFHNTTGESSGDYGSINPQAIGYNSGNSAWIPEPRDVVTSIEQISIPDADGLQSTQQIHHDIALRVESMETELRSALQQLTAVKNDLNSLHQWAGHMSYVVNEMQLCQRGFSPIIKTFGILLPTSLRPPQDDTADDASE